MNNLLGSCWDFWLSLLKCLYILSHCLYVTDEQPQLWAWRRNMRDRHWCGWSVKEDHLRSQCSYERLTFPPTGCTYQTTQYIWLNDSSWEKIKTLTWLNYTGPYWLAYWRSNFGTNSNTTQAVYTFIVMKRSSQKQEAHVSISPSVDTTSIRTTDMKQLNCWLQYVNGQNKLNIVWIHCLRFVILFPL